MEKWGEVRLFSGDDLQVVERGLGAISANPFFSSLSTWLVFFPIQNPLKSHTGDKSVGLIKGLFLEEIKTIDNNRV